MKEIKITVDGKEFTFLADLQRMMDEAIRAKDYDPAEEGYYNYNSSDIGKVIFGYESWWKIITKPEEFSEITDETINNQWYVQMLKGMVEKEATADGESKE